MGEGMKGKPTSPVIAVDWLLREYLPACLELAEGHGAAGTLRGFAENAALRDRAEWLNKKLLPALNFGEPADLLGLIEKAADNPLYAKVNQAIHFERDGFLRGAALIGAGKAWYAAVNAIGVATRRAGGEADMAALNERVREMNDRLEYQLDERLKATLT